MPFPWPQDSPRIPVEGWITEPVTEFARRYDDVDAHGWYRNLDRTADQLAAHLREGDLLVDYSGGTGILEGRLFRRCPNLQAGILIVDASAKFLRLALEKFRFDPRVAFRLIRRDPDEQRLQLLDEVLPASLRARGVDALVSANAIHLYRDLPDLLGSWRRVLKPDGQVFIQSGNIQNPMAAPDLWIIDATVDAVARQAFDIVREDERYARHRPVLADSARMDRHEALRRKYFLPVRPLEHYRTALETAGFDVVEVSVEPIEARVDEWYEFLSVYHEGVLGWVGGVEKVEGRPASDPDVADRLAILREAMNRMFHGHETFLCGWTHVLARARGGV